MQNCLLNAAEQNDNSNQDNSLDKEDAVKSNDENESPNVSHLSEGTPGKKRHMSVQNVKKVCIFSNFFYDLLYPLVSPFHFKNVHFYSYSISY